MESCNTFKALFGLLGKRANWSTFPMLCHNNPGAAADFQRVLDFPRRVIQLEELNNDLQRN